MSQNVNLFNPAFRKQRRVLTLAAVAQCLGLTLAVLFAYHYYLQEKAGGLAAEFKSADGLLKSQLAFSEKLRGKPGVAKSDPRLEADIAQLESDLKLAQESIAALKGSSFGNQRGFAEYLRAFSRQSVNGLWLTGFTIVGNGELEIRGRVLSPELLPSYIQRLNHEQVLAGRSFARLEMSQPKPKPEAAKDKDAGKPARELRFLEFSLATTDVAGAEKTP